MDKVTVHKPESRGREGPYYVNEYRAPEKYVLSKIENGTLGEVVDSGAEVKEEDLVLVEE